MTLDYTSPIYPVRQAAEAAGYNVNTLRALYQRGRFRIVGGEEAKKAGLRDMLTLADIMHVAATKRLTDLGVDPAEAFEATIAFAHSGDGSGKRKPARIFPERDHAATFLIFYGASRSARVIASDDGLGHDQLSQDPETGQPSPVAVVLLNEVVRAVANCLADVGASKLEELA